MQDSTKGAKAARIRLEIQALREHLCALDKGVQELKAQFERSATTIYEALGNLGSVAAAEERESASLSTQSSLVPQVSETGGKLHEDALRYARLLVAEIELYNKEEVARGRENKDLYTRLKFHIDRSRKAYDSRFGQSMIQRPDYFHEELMRALAQNDPSRLGPDYPSPDK